MHSVCAISNQSKSGEAKYAKIPKNQNIYECRFFDVDSSERRSSFQSHRQGCHERVSVRRERFCELLACGSLSSLGSLWRWSAHLRQFHGISCLEGVSFCRLCFLFFSLLSLSHLRCFLFCLFICFFFSWFVPSAAALPAPLLAQLSHSGRQTPAAVSWQPIAPSPVPLRMFPSAFFAPREMTLDEIRQAREEFVQSALVLARGMQWAAFCICLFCFCQPV